MPEHPYLQWPVFRRSIVAAFDRSLTNPTVKQSRSTAMPFEKGRSGNPNGRPPVGRSVAEKIRALAGDDGAVYLMELHRMATESPSDRVRLAAIGVLLERGYGKPPETLELLTSEKDPEVDLVKFMTTPELETVHKIYALAQRRSEGEHSEPFSEDEAVSVLPS